MIELKTILSERKEYLLGLSTDLKRSIACAPKGKLRISCGKDKPQYYLRSDRSDPNGKYIRQSERHLAAAIAQRDYDSETLKAASGEIEAIEALLRIWEKGTVEDTYNILIPARKQLVIPATMTDDEYARLWQEVRYSGKGFGPLDPEIYSSDGQRVRSKSEALLKDNFNHFKIPCRYEYPIRLCDERIIYPDYMLLNINQRKEFIWEHFGKADDPDYMRNNVQRLNDLILSGFIPGYNLIMTFETKDTPLNQKVVRELIKHYLL